VIEGAVAGVTPLPLTPIVVGELLALLANVIVPLAFPAVVGAKPTLTDTLCPAARLIGSVGPAAVNAPVDALSEESVTAVPPVFVTETVWEVVLPTLTFPRLTDAGLAVIAPGVEAEVPMPLTAMAVGALLALLPTVIVPLAFPAPVGVNATRKETVCPGIMFIGSEGPLAVNAAVDELSEERMAVIWPVLVTVKT
jgi:hypothetical protein